MTCFQHTDREAFVQCQRCSRPLCSACMVEAPVGFHCPVCLEEARRRRPTPRTQFGVRVGSGRPLVTYAVIIICVIMYAAQLITGLYAPRLGVTGLPDVTERLAYAPLHTSEWFFEPWRMVTSAVLHSPSSAMHIMFNMVALWFVGRVIEPEIGRMRFSALLLLSACGGSVASLFLTDPVTPTVGASGAVFGLFGALFILQRASGAESGGIVALIAINMVVSFMVPNISWQGHLGGLVIGALVALIIAHVPRGPHRTTWQGLGLSAIGVLLVVLTALGIPLVDPPYTF